MLKYYIIIAKKYMSGKSLITWKVLKFQFERIDCTTNFKHMHKFFFVRTFAFNILYSAFYMSRKKLLMIKCIKNCLLFLPLSIIYYKATNIIASLSYSGIYFLFTLLLFSKTAKEKSLFWEKILSNNKLFQWNIVKLLRMLIVHHDIFQEFVKF